MPNRILKESLVTSAGVDRLTAEEERLFTRLIVIVDDFGRIDARLPLLRAKCFPLKDLRDDQVKPWLDGLRLAGLIKCYTVDGREYLELVGWKAHQRTPRAKASKCPNPPWLGPELKNPHADAREPRTNAPVIRDSGVVIRESRIANRDSVVQDRKDDPIAPPVETTSESKSATPPDKQELEPEPPEGRWEPDYDKPVDNSWVLRGGVPQKEPPSNAPGWRRVVGASYERCFGLALAGRPMLDFGAFIDRGVPAIRIAEAIEAVFSAKPRPRVPLAAIKLLLENTPANEPIHWKTRAEIEAEQEKVTTTPNRSVNTWSR